MNENNSSISITSTLSLLLSFGFIFLAFCRIHLKHIFLLIFSNRPTVLPLFPSMYSSIAQSFSSSGYILPFLRGYTFFRSACTYIFDFRLLFCRFLFGLFLGHIFLILFLSLSFISILPYISFFNSFGPLPPVSHLTPPSPDSRVQAC